MLGQVLTVVLAATAAGVAVLVGPLPATALATLVLLAASARMHLHLGQPSTWTRSWHLVGVGQVLVVASAMGSPEHAGDLADLGAAAGSLVTAAGLTGVLRDRTTRGRAFDMALEILLAASALGFAFLAVGTAPDVPSVTSRAALAVLPPLATLAALWLLARAVEVTPEGRSALHLGAAGSALLLGAQTWQAFDLLTTGPGPTFGPVVLTVVGAIAWAATFVHPALTEPGPNLPLSGFDLQPTNLLTLLTPLLLGPLVAVADLSTGEGRTWVALVGSFLLPLLVVWLLVRQVRLRARREYLAQHDPLTGLPNQRLFLDEVEIELARVRREGGGFAVMFLDLDRFKTVNDSLGHDVGDDLLRAVGRRLLEAVRDVDSVARVGGDEFTVLCPGVDDEAEARAHALRLQQMLSAPLRVGDRELYTGASVGVVLAPGDGATSGDVLKHADTAMYRAKAGGVGRVQTYSNDLRTRAQVRLALEQELRAAIGNGDLRLHYQPKVRADDHAVVGHEALVRWNHPRLGLVTPAGFVELAEETGTIVELGRWVLREACLQARAWADAGTWYGPVAVNISPIQLADTPLDVLVDEVLRETAVHPRMLELELTETVLLRDLDAAAETIAAIRARGVAVTLDDFGTGYSGLAYLARIPLDRIKLDRSFVQTIAHGETPSPLVEAALRLGASLGLEVVAEGVETLHQAEWLRVRGCDTFQGYLFGEPAPAEAEVVSVPMVVDPWRINRTILAVCRNDDVEPGGMEELLALLDQAGTSPMASVTMPATATHALLSDHAPGSHPRLDPRELDAVDASRRER